MTETTRYQPQTLSITPQKKAQYFQEEDELLPSPTRVLDFPQENALPEEWPEETEQPEEEPAETIIPLSNNNGSIYRRTSASRRQRQPFQALPTLDETSSGSSGDLEEGGDSFSSMWQTCDSDASSSSTFLLSDHTGVRLGKDLDLLPVRKKSDRKQQLLVKPRTYLDRVKEMEAKALHLAETGQEEQAITIFRKLLRRNGTEITRIKNQMNQVDGKHPRSVDSIHSRLLEDWSKVSMSTGFVRICLANLYQRQGNYRKALSSCREALDTYKRHASLTDTHEGGILVHDLVQEAQDALGKMKKAEASFEDRKERHEEIVNLRNFMMAAEDPSLMTQVEKMALDAKEVEIETLGELHPQVADTCIILSELAQEQGDYQKALRLAMEALGISKSVLGGSHPQTGTTLLHVARLHDATKSDEAALDYYNSSLKVLQPLKVSKEMIGSILNDVAIVHIRRRQLDLAIKTLKEALESYKSEETSKGPSDLLDISTNCELVQVWRNLGECHFQKREHNEASKALVNALNIQRDIRRTHDAINQSKLGQVAVDRPTPFFATDASIAETLRRLGRAYRGDEKFHEATAVLREAILIHRLAVSRAMSNSEKGSGAEHLSVKQDELANSIYCLAEVRADTSDLDGATRLFGDSLQLRLFSDANKFGARTNLVHCAMCMVGMGNIHVKKEEFKLAHSVYGDALAYCDAHGT
jgi:tetratricopeptide (TPR) repeat protein